jgi:predicted DCC family thiol-disulfide oxidoreductase YuxK
MKKQIILFDGVCNLCNTSVQFVIQRDTSGKFNYAALQSVAGQKLLKENNLPANEFYSIILIKNGEVFQRSRAALEIARELSGLWPLLYVFVIVPPFIRNGIYNWIAKNRYRWFGRKEECMIPTPELKSRFLN